MFKNLIIELAVAIALMVCFHYACILTDMKIYECLTGVVCMMLAKDLIKEAK